MATTGSSSSTSSPAPAAAAAGSGILPDEFSRFQPERLSTDDVGVINPVVSYDGDGAHGYFVNEGRA